LIGRCKLLQIEALNSAKQQSQVRIGGLSRQCRHVELCGADVQIDGWLCYRREAQSDQIDLSRRDLSDPRACPQQVDRHKAAA
jgi:hypothetical protein